jgi:hypothetical protein
MSGDDDAAARENGGRPVPRSVVDHQHVAIGQIRADSVDHAADRWGLVVRRHRDQRSAAPVGRNVHEVADVAPAKGVWHNLPDAPTPAELHSPVELLVDNAIPDSVQYVNAETAGRI